MPMLAARPAPVVWLSALSLMLGAVLLLAVWLQPRWHTGHQWPRLLPSQGTPVHTDWAALQQLSHNSLAHPPNHALPPWQGAGRQTLRHLWPLLQRQQADQQPRLLSLQLAQYAQQPMQQHYVDFPNRYALELGTPTQLQLSFVRVGLWQWQADQVCAYRPQPLLDLKRCPSDRR